MLKATFTYGLGELLNKLILLVLLPVFTRYLTTADYGVFSLLALFYLFIPPIFITTIEPHFRRLYFEEGYSRDQIVWTALATLLGATGIVAIGALFTDRQIGMTLIGVMCLTCQLPARWKLQLEKKAALFVVISLTINLIAAALSLWLVVWQWRGVSGWVEATMISHCIGLVLYLLPMMKVKVSVSPPLLTHLIKRCIPLVPSAVAFFVLQHGIRPLITHFHSMHETGIFALSFNLAVTMALGVDAFGAAFAPRSMDKRSPQALGHAMSMYLTLFGWGVFAYFLLAKPVVTTMAAPEYLAAYKIVPLIATGYFFRGIFLNLQPGCVYADKMWATTVSYIVGAVFGIAVSWILIPHFGAYGGGIGLLIGMATLPVTLYIIMARQHLVLPHINYRQVILCLVGIGLLLTDQFWQLSPIFLGSSMVSHLRIEPLK